MAVSHKITFCQGGRAPCILLSNLPMAYPAIPGEAQSFSHLSSLQNNHFFSFLPFVPFLKRIGYFLFLFSLPVPLPIIDFSLFSASQPPHHFLPYAFTSATAAARVIDIASSFHLPPFIHPSISSPSFLRTTSQTRFSFSHGLSFLLQFVGSVVVKKYSFFLLL